MKNFGSLVLSATSVMLLLEVATCRARSFEGQPTGGSGADDDDSLDIHKIHLPQVAAATGFASTPIYVSPFVRPERRTATFEPSESSQSPPNYLPAVPAASPDKEDLRASASYGHHHHNHHHGYGYGPSGWLDMGAWTGGKGSFGWYADYPVGGGKHGGYGYGR